MKVAIGAGSQQWDGWVSTQKEDLNLLDESSWSVYFGALQADAFLCEHVFEHLTLEEAKRAAGMVFRYLKNGGYFRVAVPDLFFKDETYQQIVQVGGPGPLDHPAADHKIVYHYRLLSEVLKDAGFQVRLLEYHDEAGVFHLNTWDVEDGPIYRSSKIDPRNQGGMMKFPSLIIDALKPVQDRKTGESDNRNCLLFDLDGTIGNTLPLCITAFREAIEPSVGRKLSDAEIIAQFGPSEEGTIRALVPNDYDHVVSSYLEFYERLHWMCPEPFEGIRELLISLKEKDWFLGLVTGKGEHSTRITLKAYRFDDLFDVIKTGSELGPVKAQRFEEIMLEHSVERDSVLYVGDAPSDIDACRSAGIRVAAASWADTADKTTLEQKSPDFLFESVAELSEFLNGRNAD